MTKESAVIAKDGELGVDRYLETLVDSLGRIKGIWRKGVIVSMQGNRGNTTQVKIGVILLK